MGCANSKQKQCHHCSGSFSSPVRRSYSMTVHHLPLDHEDSYHVVALSSTTLGSLELDPSYQVITNNDYDQGDTVRRNAPKKIKEFSVALIEAKTWSNMISEKIPKVVPRTPVRTPPGEPEMINAWELMEGLEDDTCPNFRSPNQPRSFSFDCRKSNLQQEEEEGTIWPVQMEDGSDFDPEVISSFQKSLQDLSEDSPFHLKPLGFENDNKNDHKFKDKVVLYFTSLRGVRKTYEDCCRVRGILKGINVRVDERDVSMDLRFKDELKVLLEDDHNGLINNSNGFLLPKVFVGKKLIGGAEEIRKLHEDGRLEKVLDGCQNGDGDGVCDACGDIRFVPCGTCFGSCKVYYEDNEEEEGNQSEYGFKRCPDCNENGLIRCLACCY